MIIQQANEIIFLIRELVKKISSGKYNNISILDNSALLVQDASTLTDELDKENIFNSFLTTTGVKSDVAVDMRVNGSTTPQTFYIKPQSATKDLFIHNVIFTIADAGATLNKFGNINELTNGLTFFYESVLGTEIIRTNLKSNFEIGRMCGFKPAFGNGSGAFRANNAIGTSEVYLFEYNFALMNGFKEGLLLRAGTNQRLGITINDDITGIDKFDVYVSGKERLV